MKRTGPPCGGPGWSSGFTRFGVGLFGLGLRLTNDDLRAVQREIIELHAKALAVGMRPNGPDCLPVVALVFLGHGIDAMARRGGVLLAHAKSPFVVVGCSCCCTSGLRRE